MGSVGDAYNIAMAESFFSTLEAELLSRRRFTPRLRRKMTQEQRAGAQRSTMGRGPMLRTHTVPTCLKRPSA